MDQAIDWYMIIASIIGTAAVIAAATPNKYDDKLAKFARMLLDFVGSNFRNAKNKE